MYFIGGGNPQDFCFNYFVLFVWVTQLSCTCKRDEQSKSEHTHSKQMDEVGWMGGEKIGGLEGRERI